MKIKKMALECDPATAQRALIERLVQLRRPRQRRGGKPSHIVYAVEA
jgi:hypothetical protein